MVLSLLYFVREGERVVYPCIKTTIVRLIALVLFWIPIVLLYGSLVDFSLLFISLM